MCKGTWEILPAVGLVAALFGFGLGAVIIGLNDPGQNRYPGYYEAAEQPPGLNAGSLPKTKPLKKRYPCDDPESASEAELCAEWHSADADESSAFWAQWGVWITGLGIIGLIITIAQGRRALERARQANKIAEEAVDAQNRPWVDFEVEPHRGFYIEEDGSLSFGIKVTFTNFGATPAIGLTYFPSLIFGDQIDEFLKINTARFEDGTIDWADKNLFPNKPWPRTTICSHTGKSPGKIKTHLVILAAYRSAFSRTIRFTAKAYEITSDDPTKLIDFDAPPLGKTATHLSAKSFYAGLMT